MSIIRRIRGALGVAVTWGAAYAIVGGAWMTVEWMLGNVLPQFLGIRFFLGVLGINFLMGAATGTVFAALVLLKGRHRTIADLPTRTLTVGGLLGAAILPLAMMFIFPGSTGYASTTSMIGATLATGAVGAAIAFGTLRIARRSAMAQLESELGNRAIDSGQ